MINRSFKNAFSNNTFKNRKLTVSNVAKPTKFRFREGHNHCKLIQENTLLFNDQKYASTITE